MRKNFCLEIGGYEFRVEFHPQDRMPKNVNGYTIHNLHIIVACGEYDYLATRAILLHEAVHALLGTQGRVFQERFTDEEVCELIAQRFDEIRRIGETIEKELEQ